MKKTVSMVASKAHAKKSGVKLLGSYIAPPEHVLFLIIEANDYGKIVDFLRPIMKMETHRIMPVSALEDVKSKFE